MSQGKEQLTKESLKTRSQICVFESSVTDVEIDSRTLSRLISLGSAKGEGASFAKLYGFLDIQRNQVQVKDCIALPCLGEDEKRTLDTLEAEEKNIRTNLGFNYQCVGTFVVSRNEDSFGENMGFYLTHFNVYEGFGVMLVYSSETAKSSQQSPIKAYVPSQELSNAYKYKTDKEFFEPNPGEVSTMISKKKEFFREIGVKAGMSPVLELILKKNQHRLREKNPVVLKVNSEEALISNLEGALTQTVSQMMNVMNSKRSLEMRRQHLLNFGGAITRMTKLLALKRRKLQEDSQKLRNLESLANPSHETN